MDRDEIIKLASQAIDDTRSAVSLPIPFVMRFAVLVAAAERAKRERQEPVAYLTADKNMLVFADKCVDMQHLMTPLYAAPPVTAPVRLMDSDTHAKDLRRMARKIGHPAGDVPSVMRAAADRIDELERLVAAFQRAEAGG